eukprot:symbB.v1.2.027839.t1/scaffold2889.1/size67885/2
MAALPRLCVGLCDGRVAVAVADGHNWRMQRVVVVGAQPVKLLVLPKMEAAEIGPKLPKEKSDSTEEVLLAISGHGSILQVQSEHIVQSPVCLPSMSHAAFFSHGLAGIQHCMAFISEERLLLAMLHCGERMHVRTLQLPQPPRRIAYHPPSGVCVAGCCDMSTLSSHPSRNRSQLQFVHAETVNLLDTITLGLDEMIASVDTVSFAGDPTLYIAVGTAVVLPSEPEPTRGQIRLLEPCQSSSSNEVALPPFRVVNTLEVSGAVYALHGFQGRLLGAEMLRLKLWVFAMIQ